MPPVFGPVSSSYARLWSWLIGMGQNSVPFTQLMSENSWPSRTSSMTPFAPAAPKRWSTQMSHKAHERELLAVEEVLDDHLRAGRAEAVVHEDVVERGNRGVLIHRHGLALARGQAIGLDYDRRAMFLHIQHR